MVSAIAWNNQVRLDADGVLAVSAAQGTFTTNAFNSGYPANNAINPDPAKASRVDYQTSTSAPYESRVEANWTNNANVRVVAALNVRLASTVVGVRFVVVNSAGTTLETTAQILKANLLPIPGTTDRFNVYAILSATRSVNRVRFQVQIPASSTDNYEVGYLWASDALVLSENWGSGWQWFLADSSLVTPRNDGYWSTYAFTKRHGLMLRRAHWPQIEAFGDPSNLATPSLAQILLECGMSSPIIAVVGTNEHERQRYSKYGLIREAPTLTNMPGKLWDAALKIY